MYLKLESQVYYQYSATLKIWTIQYSESFPLLLVKIFFRIRQVIKKKFTHRSITSANPFATHQHLALGLGVSFSLAFEMRCKPSGVRVLIDKLSLRAARTAHCACKRLSGAQCDPRCEEGNIGRHLLQLTVQIPPPPRQPPKWA